MGRNYKKWNEEIPGSILSGGSCEWFHITIAQILCWKALFSTVEKPPRNRFQLILQFLHFVDNSHYNANGPNRDRLYKVRPVVQYLVSKLKSVYITEEHISIDEKLLLWKGELLLKQYIALKRPRFGIKMFSICETKYQMLLPMIWKWWSFSGRATNSMWTIGTLVRNCFSFLYENEIPSVGVRATSFNNVTSIS